MKALRYATARLLPPRARERRSTARDSRAATRLLSRLVANERIAVRGNRQQDATRTSPAHRGRCKKRKSRLLLCFRPADQSFRSHGVLCRKRASAPRSRRKKESERRHSLYLIPLRINEHARTHRRKIGVVAGGRIRRRGVSAGRISGNQSVNR